MSRQLGLFPPCHSAALWSLPTDWGHESGWVPKVEGEDVCWQNFSGIQRRGRAVWLQGLLFPHLGGGT